MKIKMKKQTKSRHINNINININVHINGFIQRQLVASFTKLNAASLKAKIGIALNDNIFFLRQLSYAAWKMVQ